MCEASPFMKFFWQQTHKTIAFQSSQNATLNYIPKHFSSSREWQAIVVTSHHTSEAPDPPEANENKKQTTSNNNHLRQYVACQDSLLALFSQSSATLLDIIARDIIVERSPNVSSSDTKKNVYRSVMIFFWQRRSCEEKRFDRLCESYYKCNFFLSDNMRQQTRHKFSLGENSPTHKSLVRWKMFFFLSWCEGKF